MNTQPAKIVERRAEDRFLSSPMTACVRTDWRLNITIVAESAYVAFLLLVFIGISPFATPDTIFGTDPVSASGAGDAVRQISYLLIFGAIAAAAAARRGWQAFLAIPTLFALLLLWCVVSTGWSLEPSVTFRRAVLLCVVAASVLISIDTIGVPRCLQLLRYVLAGVIVIDWMSIFLIPQAKHMQNDIEQSVVGDWRGLHGHKNIAGAFCANAVMIFLYFAATTRRRSDVLLCLASLGFLIGTNSKSSIGLLPIALIAGGIYTFSTTSRINRQIIFVTSTLFLSIVSAIVFAWWDTITLTLRDPELFTGRGAIWQAELAFIWNHPLLGSGFGSFAYTGKNSPIYQYIDAAWAGAVASGHQGYLELLVTIGVPGFCLAIACFVAEPIAWLVAADRLGIHLRALLVSLFAFFFMHNLMESNFLKTDGTEWVIFLLAFAILRRPRTVLSPEPALSAT